MNLATDRTDVRDAIYKSLRRGVAIPASPLALNAQRNLDERRQRALFRYYAHAGAGGIAVGVHTTQFAIRDPKFDLFKPILELAREEFDRADRKRPFPMIRIGGICGRTPQALREAALLCGQGFHMGLLSLGALAEASAEELIAHCSAVADVIPIVGFYLQPAVGGRILDYRFWRQFADIPQVVAIKVAPFNRYQTLDVVRAIADSGREDIVLYTGNDDNIVLDLLTPYRFCTGHGPTTRHIVGGLLGHWSVWTERAVDLLEDCHVAVRNGTGASPAMLVRSLEVTDCNAAFFDAANRFAGCIAGLHEVLRRQGLLEGIWCLDPNEGLSPGQMQEIDRVYRVYPHLNDDKFVQEHRDKWLSG